MSNYFPQGIIIEILHKLPVKSIVRCISICKSWSALIVNPTFISTHLNQTISSTEHSLFLLRFCSKEDYFSLHFDDEEFSESMKLDYPLKSIDRYFSLIGSCNGLICLADYLYAESNTFILWNPSVSKFITLPKPNITMKSPGEYHADVGFGFDSIANDYKVLRIVKHAYKEDSASIEIYSLVADYWKILSTVVLNYGIVTSCSQAFVNGVVHFIAYKSNEHGRTCKFLVLGFDLSSEVFFDMTLPESFAEEIRSVVVYKESTIAIFTSTYYCPIQCHLWVMEKYGVEGSWIKLLSIRNELKAIPRAFGLRKSGELLLEFHGGELASYDTKRQKIKNLNIHQKAGNYFLHTYVQSLVLLDKANYQQCNFC